jgi:signal transduction histidine kinase
MELLERERAARGEAEASRLRAEAEVRARGEFLALAAHELRTPITSLRGYSQRLLRGIEKGRPVEGSGAQRALEVIDQQADKLARLVSQLLDVSRVQAGTLSLDIRPTDVSALMAEVTAATQQMTRHPLRVTAPPGITAWVDPLRLEQVLLNLVDNAIKYSVDEGSAIEIDVMQPTPQAIEIAVRDWGLGIPEEYQEHVFERYYQAGGSRHTGGMGLGLYISRQIVEAHGGSIQVDSPVDGGTRFVVTLPSGESATGSGQWLDTAAPTREAVSIGAARATGMAVSSST